MTVLKTICAAMLALALCTGARADDPCPACGEKKPRCAECDRAAVSDTAKRCATPVKNFFVHTVGGTISGNIARGFGLVKSDCGCGK